MSLEKTEDPTPSLSEAERLGLQKAFQVISKDRKKLEQQGLSSISFALGVFNVGLTAFILGGYPQFMWVWHTFKTSFFLFYQMYRRWKNKKILYHLDFCWIAALATFTWSMLELLNIMPPILGREFYCLMFALANGPLGWSVIALGNSLVFHSLDHTSSLFIHLSPVLTTWSLRWHEQAVRDAWGSTRFQFAYDANIVFDTLLVFGVPFAFYLSWWILYTIWLVAFGVNSPKKGYDTVFEYNRKTLKLEQMWLFKNRPIRVQAVFYMLLHLFAIMLTFLWPLICWRFFFIHTAWAVCLVAASVFNGASFYNYWLGHRFARAIDKLLAAPGSSIAYHIDEDTNNVVESPTKKSKKRIVKKDE